MSDKENKSNLSGQVIQNYPIHPSHISNAITVQGIFKTRKKKPHLRKM